ncbi:formyltetrahydrofolate deformylase [Opitutus sp. GAS368]|jgi:formyltetrahydrofolate deformylase|uniref:formyltetrahydrofolate deformylase n=1 Tax=Opitutus sp. GAS368 TaxID=1882749 RepID=UPI00087D9964|nr:formyltetrahydrofolate deformylase [Opitutus sp. GAS368]SDR87363.1 formyltetrahydrofolate deformylase [Opitutus sp. GAS368]
MKPPATLVALLHGPDQPGIVAKTAGWIFARHGNILHADQHRDMEAGEFFQRIEWVPAGADAAQEAADLHTFAATLGMAARVAVSPHRAKGVIFVSKEDHCFHDLALRWKAGEFAGDFACVISNHPDLGDVARHYGLAFHHVPVTLATKAAAEAQQLDILRATGTEFVVLARYMQVLSEDFLKKAGQPVINIHHSFLPAFAGGKPYHQAHERGVKLIGATAHYVTAVLDDGPIIQQDVVRVTHRHSVEDLVRKGRDLEKLVLAQALRWHLDNRVLVYGNKTVVFD